MSTGDFGLGGRICGCLSCHNDATAIVRHPQKGRRAVCPEHAFGYPVLEEL